VRGWCNSGSEITAVAGVGCGVVFRNCGAIAHRDAIACALDYGLNTIAVEWLPQQWRRSIYTRCPAAPELRVLASP